MVQAKPSRAEDLVAKLGATDPGEPTAEFPQPKSYGCVQACSAHGHPCDYEVVQLAARGGEVLAGRHQSLLLYVTHITEGGV